jgi:hypothetical protein
MGAPAVVRRRRMRRAREPGAIPHPEVTGMATLTSTNVIPQYTTGGADLLGVYALRNVNAGDTIDLATLGAPVWQLIVRAVVIGVSDSVANSASTSGTVVTMPSGLTTASGYLMAWGMLGLLEGLNRTQTLTIRCQGPDTWHPGQRTGRRLPARTSTWSSHDCPGTGAAA